MLTRPDAIGVHHAPSTASAAPRIACRLPRWVYAVVGLLLVVPGPAGAAPDAGAPPPHVLRYAFPIAETGFDPVQLSDLYSRVMARHVFDAPYRYAYLAPAGTIELNTAAALPVMSADFRTLTIRLKPGITFTDDPAFKGQRRELVAQDYVYSIKRFYDPRWKSPSFGTFETADLLGMAALRDEALKSGRFDYDREVEGLRALDRYTLQMKFGRPSPRFAASLTDASVVGAVAREVVEAYGDAIMEHPVGTGPFVLKEWRRSSRLVFERNPAYREDLFSAQPDPSDARAVAMAAALQGRRLPLLDRVEVSIIEESQPRWLAFLNGEHDVLEDMYRDLAPLALPNGKPSPTLVRKGITITRVPRIDYTFAVYNMDNPVIGGYTPERVALRRALNLAIDKFELIRTLYKGQAFPAQGPIMPRTYGYDPEIRTEMGSPDPARANAILDAYGYVDRDGDGWRDRPDGSPLIIDYSTQPDQNSRINDEIWKKSLDAIHVRLNFKVAKWPEQLKQARSGTFMVWSLGLSASAPDSGGSYQQAYGPATGAENLSRFKLAAYDRLFLEQDAMPDGPERLGKLREMTRLLLAYAPMNYLTHRYALDLNYPWVSNFIRWPFASEWWRYVDVDPAHGRAPRS
jgi:ABC-type transport system substrate-binding protein